MPSKDWNLYHSNYVHHSVWATGWTTGLRFPEETKRFPSSTVSKQALRQTQPATECVRDVKRPEPETGHSPVPTADDKHTPPFAITALVQGQLYLSEYARTYKTQVMIMPTIT
jgi:hypothetical protein